MIIGIEGTGSQGWGDDDLCRTFVRRVLHATRLRPASYFIGPVESGSDGMTIIDAAYTALRQGAHNKPIVLMGYSRGGAYVMEVAKRFKQPIDTMILFDAVARQHDHDLPEKVPHNVKHCAHAYRDPRAGSRYFFQNVGLTPETRLVDFRHAMFFGSHGALGGTSWDAKRDESGDTLGNATIGADDRQLLNVPRFAVTGKKEDEDAMWGVVNWIWPILEEWKILPANTDRFQKAPSFEGSRIAGTRNMIR
jgi:pimeloyl-ACP methyl ester carboxylesterase